MRSRVFAVLTGLGVVGSSGGCSQRSDSGASIGSAGVDGAGSTETSKPVPSATVDTDGSSSAASSGGTASSGYDEVASGSDAESTGDTTPGFSETSNEDSAESSSPLPTGACDDGWCRRTQAGFGDRVLQIAGSRNGSVVFATTETNELLEYREERWTYREGPFERGDVLLVVGDADVWVGNPAGAWRWDGKAWEQVTEGNVRSLVATTRGAVWGLIDGIPNLWTETGWTAQAFDVEGETPAELQASDSSDELWLLTSALDGRRTKGQVYTWDETQWLGLPGSGSEYGADWRLTHFDDRLFVYDEFFGIFDALAEWAPVGDALTATAMAGVPGEGLVSCAPTPAFLEFDDASALSARELSPWPCSALWARSGDDIWTANVLGGVTHLTIADNVVDAPLAPAGDVAAFSQLPTPVWVGPGTVDAWGTGPLDVWAEGTRHWDGQVWSERSTQGAVHTFGTSTDDVWFVNNNYTAPRRWDGAQVSSLTVGSALGTGALAFQDGVATAKDEAWFAVTQYDAEFNLFGAVLHAKTGTLEDKFAFHTELLGPTSLMAAAFLAGDAENGLWLGLPGELWRQVGDTWELASKAPEGEYFTDGEVFGEHLWVLVGQTIAQFDGDALQRRGKRRGATRLSVTGDGSLWAHSPFGAARWTP